jgi:hypothetical protein
MRTLLTTSFCSGWWYKWRSNSSSFRWKYRAVSLNLFRA